MKYLLLIICTTFTITNSQAVTLKSLAIKSNHLLVISNRLAAQQKVCSLDFTQVSEISQNLKADIDSKIASLQPKDLEIIKNRSATCAADCTCDIYSLALEHHSIDHSELDKNAQRLTAADREKCLKISGRKICAIKR